MWSGRIESEGKTPEVATRQAGYVSAESSGAPSPDRQLRSARLKGALRRAPMSAWAMPTVWGQQQLGARCRRPGQHGPQRPTRSARSRRPRAATGGPHRRLDVSSFFPSLPPQPQSRVASPTVAHVLVIEDDADIRGLLVTSLADRGFAASSAATGMTGLNQALERSPDIVLLDLGLPDVDGLRVLSMLRAVSSVPVIIVTAQDDDRRVVQGLEAGADDYVVKPFTVDQLAARINAVLRRGAAAATTNPVLVVGELRIHLAERTVEFAGEPLELSRLEFDLLAYLAEHTGEVVSKRELLTEVWKQAYGGGEHSVDVHVSWLRRKLGETAAAPVYIHSIRHVGVRLAAPEITPAER